MPRAEQQAVAPRLLNAEYRLLTVKIVIPTLRRHRFPGVLALLCLFPNGGCAVRSHYDVLPVRYDEAHLTRSWIGFNDRDASCYTLLLTPGGGGVLYSQFGRGSTATNRIASWTRRDDLLTCVFERCPDPHNPSKLICTIKTDLLIGSLSGAGGWRENVLFRRPDFIERCLTTSKKTNAVNP